MSSSARPTSSDTSERDSSLRRQQERDSTGQRSGLDSPLLAKVVHELRQPLHSVGAALAVAKRSGALRADSTAAQVAERQLFRAFELLNELTAGVREGRTTFSIHPAEIDLRTVVGDAVQAARASAAEAGLTLVVSLPRRPLVVHGDAERLGQAISNVLANATRLTPRGGFISVGAKPDGGSAVVWIRDSGPGIDPDDLRRIFLPHVGRAHRHGLGLGLAIAREIVEAHGGTIDAHSRGVGGGAEFRITCPQSSARHVPRRIDGGGGRTVRNGPAGRHNSHTRRLPGRNGRVRE